MITRIWHGRTNAANAQRYLNFLLEDGTKDYRNTDGNVSARVWKSNGEDRCDFWTVTEWRNIESVKQFAGDDFQKARYYPIDSTMLVEFEEHVQHYESFDVSNGKIKSHIMKLALLYAGGNWVGESFKGKLDGVTEQIAFSQPQPGVHSVAELVWHSVYWRRVTLDRLQGGGNKYRNETMEKLNFLPLADLKLKGWDVLLNELEETQRALIELLQEKKDEFLINEYQPGYSYDFLIEGTVQHDYYHLGQIGLVLKILKLKTADDFL